MGGVSASWFVFSFFLDLLFHHKYHEQGIDLYMYEKNISGVEYSFSFKWAMSNNP